MNKILIKKNLYYTLIILSIFLLDRYFKNVVIDLSRVNNDVDIFINEFLNIYLIWNKGIAFGIFSFDEAKSYNFVTVLICIVNVVVFYLIYSSRDYRGFLYTVILGGSLGNLFDRFYYRAVPDYIDMHIKSFHWFIFNISDIFITFGVICLIFVEIFFNKSVNEK